MSQQSLLPRVLDVWKFAQARAGELSLLVDDLGQIGKLGKGVQARNIRRRAKSHRRHNHRLRPNLKKQKPAQQQTVQRKRKRSDDNDASYLQTQQTQDENNDNSCNWRNRRMRRRVGTLIQSFINDGQQLKYFRKLWPKNQEPEKLKDLRLETHIWHAKRFKMVNRWGYVLSEHAAGKGAGSRSLLRRCSQGAVLHDASYWNAIEIKVESDEAWNQILHVFRECLEDVKTLEVDLRQNAFSAGRSIWRAAKLDGVVAEVFFIIWKNSNCSVEEQNSQGSLCQILIMIHPAGYTQVLDFLTTQFTDSEVQVVPLFGQLKWIQIIGLKAREVTEQLFQSAVMNPCQGQDFFLQNQRYNLSQFSLMDPRLINNDQITDCRSILKGLETQKYQQNNVEARCNQIEIEQLFRGSGQPVTDDVINSLKKACRESNLAVKKEGLDEVVEDLNISQMQTAATVICVQTLNRQLQEVSLLVPSGWCRVIWNCLIMQQGVLGAVGQTEVRWLNTSNNFLSFPDDYPDYKQHQIMPCANRFNVWDAVGKQLSFWIQEQNSAIRKKESKLVVNDEEIQINVDDDHADRCFRSVLRTNEEIKAVLDSRFKLVWKPASEPQQDQLPSYRMDVFVHVLVSIVGKGKCSPRSVLCSQDSLLVVGFVTSATPAGSQYHPGGIGIVSLEWFGETYLSGRKKVKCKCLSEGSDTLRQAVVSLIVPSV